jgi:hypothetical protein
LSKIALTILSTKQIEQSLVQRVGHHGHRQKSSLRTAADTPRARSHTIAANWKLQLSNAVMKIYTKPFDFGRQEMFRLAACHVSYQQCSFMRL